MIPWRLKFCGWPKSISRHAALDEIVWFEMFLAAGHYPNMKFAPVIFAAGMVVCNLANTAESIPSPYAAWKNGPPPTPDFFPIAVWLQNPSRAVEYRETGINIYVGLWNGPTEEQLATLKKAGVKVICHLNEVARRHLDDPTIIGWMHGDEPDNAQSLGAGKGYGPPIPPSKIIEDYRKIKAIDSTRPILLNLGQGVAWDDWIGRGVRRRHPEDYPEYVKGCDIASFDIYPVTHSSPEVAGKLWYVARGVERLRQWAAPRPIWNCIECTRIQNPERKATPHQVRAEVWMSLVHGSRGLIYFVHEWKPKFVEAGLLADSEMRNAVTQINRQILRLAPVLNSPDENAALKTSVRSGGRVAAMLKRHDGFWWIFAVEMEGIESEATFECSELKNDVEAEIFESERKLPVKNGLIMEKFGPWDVRIFKIKAR